MSKEEYQNLLVSIQMLEEAKSKKATGAVKMEDKQTPLEATEEQVAGHYNVVKTANQALISTLEAYAQQIVGKADQLALDAKTTASESLIQTAQELCECVANETQTLLKSASKYAEPDRENPTPLCDASGKYLKKLRQLNTIVTQMHTRVARELEGDRNAQRLAEGFLQEEESAAPAVQEITGGITFSRNLRKFIKQYHCQYIEKFLGQISVNAVLRIHEFPVEGMGDVNIDFGDRTFPTFVIYQGKYYYHNANAMSPVSYDTIPQTIIELLHETMDKTASVTNALTAIPFDERAATCNWFRITESCATKPANFACIAAVPILDLQKIAHTHLYMIANNEQKPSDIVRLVLRHQQGLDHALDISHELMPTSPAFFTCPAVRKNPSQCEQVVDAGKSASEKLKEEEQALYAKSQQDNAMQIAQAQKLAEQTQAMVQRAALSQSPELVEKAKKLNDTVVAELAIITTLGEKVELANQRIDQSDASANVTALAAEVGLTEETSYDATNKRLAQLTLEVDSTVKLIEEELARQQLAEQEIVAQKAMEELVKEEERTASKKAKKSVKKKGGKLQGSGAQNALEQQAAPVKEFVSADVNTVTTKPASKRKKGAKPNPAMQNKFSVIATSESEHESAYASALEEIEDALDHTAQSQASDDSFPPIDDYYEPIRRAQSAPILTGMREIKTDDEFED